AIPTLFPYTTLFRSQVVQHLGGLLLERQRLRGTLGLASPHPRRDGVLAGVGDLQVLVEPRARLVVVVVAVRVDLLQPLHQVRGAAVAQHVLRPSLAPRGTARAHREPPELVSIWPTRYRACPAENPAWVKAV